MSFRKNDVQQFSMFDSFNTLTPREQKALYIFIKNGRDDLLEGLEHYYDPEDYNRVIYHSRSTEADNRIADLLKDADALQKTCAGMFEDITEYQLLVRCLSEQTVTEDGKRRLKKKEEGMGSGLMQNPSDPEATYREKAGKGHRGYSGFRQLAGPKGYVYSGPFDLTIIVCAFIE